MCLCRRSSVRNSNSPVAAFGKHWYVRWKVGPQLCTLHVGGTKECLSFFVYGLYNRELPHSTFYEEDQFLISLVSQGSVRAKVELGGVFRA